ncbi:hypothetical protein SFRURICE_002545 [Spodoptera frugiperda]|nr:hypothetical protein SFRURICE_002545 [Spodoptera frugiperda]
MQGTRLNYPVIPRGREGGGQADKPADESSNDSSACPTVWGSGSKNRSRNGVVARRSPATVSAGLRTASKGSSPPDQIQTRACGASRSARASKSHQTTTDGAQ